MGNSSILLLHGLFEHKGRQTINAEWFEKLNITPFLVDLPGHGKDVENKGDLESWEQNDDAVIEAFKQLEEADINYQRAILYKTVVSDLSDLENVFYDCLVFYSPAGIESLFKNFPEFQQNDTRIAVFGETTKKAAVKAGLEINIAAPAPNAPSMTGAIEAYIKEFN